MTFGGLERLLALRIAQAEVFCDAVARLVRLRAPLSRDAEVKRYKQ